MEDFKKLLGKFSKLTRLLILIYILTFAFVTMVRLTINAIIELLHSSEPTVSSMVLMGLGIIIFLLCILAFLAITIMWIYTLSKMKLILYRDFPELVIGPKRSILRSLVFWFAPGINLITGYILLRETWLAFNLKPYFSQSLKFTPINIYWATIFIAPILINIINSITTFIMILAGISQLSAVGDFIFITSFALQYGIMIWAFIYLCGAFKEKGNAVLAQYKDRIIAKSPQI